MDEIQRINAMPYDPNWQKRISQPVIKPEKKKPGNLLEALIPSAGGIAGGAAGAAIGTALLPGIGTIAGGLIGGALGGGGGKVAENALQHEDLTKGVLGEAVLNGVFSAGPLRLLQLGGEAARGIKAGASLADALTSAGSKTIGSDLLKTAGDAIANKGEKLIAKEFRLSPTQQFNFKNVHGENATTVLRRFGIKTPEDLTATIQPLQDSFNSVVHQIPDISAKDLSKGLESVYKPLLDSPALFEQNLGQQVKTQADELLKQAAGGSLSADKINSMRQLFDNAVHYTERGAPEYNVIKKTADALRSTLQGAADNAGIKVGNKTFKEIGQDLSKLHSLNDIVGKQAFNGTGSLPLNIGSLPGTVIGSSAGPLGAGVGMAANMAVNSPVGRRLMTNGAIKLGENLAERGAKNIAKNAFSPLNIAKRVAPVGLADALVSQSLGNSTQPTNPSTMTSAAIPSNSNMSQSYTQEPKQSSPFGYSSTEIGQALMKAYAAGDTAAARQLEGMYQLAAEFEKSQSSSGLSSTAASNVASNANATNTLDQLEGLFTTAGGGSGKLGGSLANALAGAGMNGNVQTYNDLAASSVSQLARALNGGGQVSDADAAVVIQALPKITDSPEVARRKFSALRERLQAAMQNTLMFSGGQSANQGNN